MEQRKSYDLGDSNLAVPETAMAETRVFLNFAPKYFSPESELLIYSVKLMRSSAVNQRIKSLLNLKINWDNFTKSAMQHALVPLVYNTLSEFSQYVPKPALDKLKHLNQTISYNNLHLTRELLRLLALMKSNGIKALPYKGPVSAEFIYGQLSLRQFGDLDILILKKDILKAKELFHSIGYLPKISRSSDQDQVFIDSVLPYNYKFFSADGRVCVELHWKFTSKINSFPINYEHIMDNLTSIKIANRTVPTLKAEDLLLILCQHGSKHSWSRLLWICDVATLIHKHPSINWGYVIDTSTNLGARRMLFLGLFLAQNLLGARLPDLITEQIKADRKVEKLSQRVVEQFTSGLEKSVHGFEIHLFSCRMRERWRDKARYSAYQCIPRSILRKL